MNNNDILRRIRYIFDFSDSKMIQIFDSADMRVTRSEVSNWLKQDDDPAYKMLNDKHFAIFLDGWINDKRGKQEGVVRKPEKNLNNNIILRKIKIALSFKNEDILEMLELGGMTISKHELSAFFRKPGHDKYRLCKDQVMRNFLKGMQVKYRP